MALRNVCFCYSSYLSMEYFACKTIRAHLDFWFFLLDFSMRKSLPVKILLKFVFISCRLRLFCQGIWYTGDSLSQILISQSTWWVKEYWSEIWSLYFYSYISNYCYIKVIVMVPRTFRYFIRHFRGPFFFQVTVTHVCFFRTVS